MSASAFKKPYGSCGLITIVGLLRKAKAWKTYCEARKRKKKRKGENNSHRRSA